VEEEILQLMLLVLYMELIILVEVVEGMQVLGMVLEMVVQE
jgi:hypothetical protein